MGARREIRREHWWRWRRRRRWKLSWPSRSPISRVYPNSTGTTRVLNIPSLTRRVIKLAESRSPHYPPLLLCNKGLLYTLCFLILSTTTWLLYQSTGTMRIIIYRKHLSLDVVWQLGVETGFRPDIRNPPTGGITPPFRPPCSFIGLWTFVASFTYSYSASIFDTVY